MRTFATVIAAVGLAVSAVAAAPAAQDPPDGFQFEIPLAKGDAVTVAGQEDTGGMSSGGITANATLGLAGGFDPNACSADAYEEKCDKALIDVTSATGGTLDVLFTPAYGGDFDLYLYESDEDGTIGEEIAHSAIGFAPVADPIGIAGPTESFTVDVKKGQYALVIFYFAAGGGYDLDTALS